MDATLFILVIGAILIGAVALAGALHIAAEIRATREINRRVSELDAAVRAYERDVADFCKRADAQIELAAMLRSGERAMRDAADSRLALQHR